jgi:cytochrome b6-f complex iron-sulfur subunit
MGARRRAQCLQCLAAMDNPKTSRRDFCAHAISLVTVASLIEGCGSKGNPGSPGGGGGVPNVPALPTVTGASAGNTVTVSNVGGTSLASVGSAALVQAGNRSVLVVRTAENSFNAFTAICTHEQCNITGFQSGAFVCPCHGSQYNTSGQVQQGPATQRLQQFQTQFTNNVLTITV